MPAPRAHVFSTCARGAGIHGDVFECIHGEGGRGEGREEGRRQPRVCSSVKQVSFDISQAS